MFTNTYMTVLPEKSLTVATAALHHCIGLEGNCQRLRVCKDLLADMHWEADAFMAESIGLLGLHACQ